MERESQLNLNTPLKIFTIQSFPFPFTLLELLEFIRLRLKEQENTSYKKLRKCPYIVIEGVVASPAAIITTKSWKKFQRKRSSFNFT